MCCVVISSHPEQVAEYFFFFNILTAITDFSFNLPAIAHSHKQRYTNFILIIHRFIRHDPHNTQKTHYFIRNGFDQIKRDGWASKSQRTTQHTAWWLLTDRYAHSNRWALNLTANKACIIGMSLLWLVMHRILSRKLPKECFCICLMTGVNL